VELAIKRVSQRVKNGGHLIPEPVIRRRYKKGLHALISAYLPQVDEATIYDNSRGLRRVIAQKKAGDLQIFDGSAWQKILEVAHE
jgi:predicted ABC-type ATPase